jgi:hypothetical protein
MAMKRTSSMRSLTTAFLAILVFGPEFAGAGRATTTGGGLYR